jgi:DNA polymerase III epsilon subunit-like protein
MTDWTDYRYAVIDTEGNGRQPPDLVELGIVPITSGVIGDPATWLFKPAAPIMAMARRIHGITNEMVAAAPDFAELADTVRTRLDGAVLVAHNAGVDLSMLRRKLPGFTPTLVLDTLKLSRRLLPGQVSYRLGSLVSALHLDHGLPADAQPHRAGYDVLVTARLLVHLATQAQRTPMSFEDLRDGPQTASDALF